MHPQHKFPLAAHSYFRITNKDEQQALFLADDTFVPTFTYSAQFNGATIAERIRSLQTSGANEAAVRALALVRSAEKLQRSNDADGTASFRKLNAALYGEPHLSYALAIMLRVQQVAALRPHPDYWRYIRGRISLSPNTDISSSLGPSMGFFGIMKTYFSEYAPWLTDGSRVGWELPAVLSHALEDTGLGKDGWTVRLSEDDSYAYVVPAAKTIHVGREYTPRTAQASLRITAHEVYGHALRSSCVSAPVESEGFAVLLEQLLDGRFKWRRAYRYLAASLGWGTLGKPMDFREVFEILWRAMVILSAYEPDVAKKHAFNECVRVFRGGRPDIAGAVFLKDTAYFAGNIAVWDALEKRRITYDDFTHIIEGKERILA